jgi:hypothetical protein
MPQMKAHSRKKYKINDEKSPGASQSSGGRPCSSNLSCGGLGGGIARFESSMTLKVDRQKSNNSQTSVNLLQNFSSNFGQAT